METKEKAIVSKPVSKYAMRKMRAMGLSDNTSEQANVSSVGVCNTSTGGSVDCTLLKKSDGSVLNRRKLRYVDFSKLFSFHMQEVYDFIRNLSSEKFCFKVRKHLEELGGSSAYDITKKPKRSIEDIVVGVLQKGDLGLGYRDIFYYIVKDHFGVYRKVCNIMLQFNIE